MRKAYELELKDGKQKVKVALRLTLAGQLALKKKYKENAIATIFGAMDDVEVFCEVLNEALNWKGNENAFTDGAELYDLLVDNGFTGYEGLGGVLFSIASASGLVTEKDRDKMIQRFGHVFDDLFSDEDIWNIPEEETEEEEEKNEK